MNKRDYILAHLVIFNTITSKTLFHNIFCILHKLARIYIFMTGLYLHAKTKISQSLNKDCILRDKNRLGARRKHLLDVKPCTFKRKYISLLVRLPISLLARISWMYTDHLWEDIYRMVRAVYQSRYEDILLLLFCFCFVVAITVLKRRFLYVNIPACNPHLLFTFTYTGNVKWTSHQYSQSVTRYNVVLFYLRTSPLFHAFHIMALLAPNEKDYLDWWHYKTHFHLKYLTVLHVPCQTIFHSLIRALFDDNDDNSVFVCCLFL